MTDTSKKLPLVGGVIAGIGASLCCVGPLVVLALGMGGAWVSSLTALEPYRPLFVVLAAAALAAAYWQIFIRPRRVECCDEKICSRPAVKGGYRLGFWLVAAFVSLSVTSPYLIPFFY